MNFKEYLLYCFLIFIALFMIGEIFFDDGRIETKGNILVFSVVGSGVFLIIIITVEFVSDEIGLRW